MERAEILWHCADTRRSAGSWLYEAGEAAYELAVDDHGRVTRYGLNFWRAVD